MLAGLGIVTVDKSIVGSHLVQIKDGNNQLLFNKVVAVRKGEQTTVFDKAGQGIDEITEAPARKSHSPREFFVSAGIEGSYGKWTTRSGGSTAVSPDHGKEIGLYLKIAGNKNWYIKPSVHYILPFSGASTGLGCFAGLDIGKTFNFFEVSGGATYFSPTTSGEKGTLGYQGFVGLNIQNASVGAKYLALNASDNLGNFSYSQLLLGASFDLFVRRQ